jgi:hypothetical protein
MTTLSSRVERIAIPQGKFTPSYHRGSIDDGEGFKVEVRSITCPSSRLSSK